MGIFGRVRNLARGMWLDRGPGGSDLPDPDAILAAEARRLAVEEREGGRSSSLAREDRSARVVRDVRVVQAADAAVGSGAGAAPAGTAPAGQATGNGPERDERGAIKKTL